MSKRTRQPIRRETEARTRSGLLSLFWMFIGAVIAVMVGLFLYLSPLFDSFRKEVDVNPPASITPLPQTPSSTNEYEFYEILPKREFRGDEAGLGEQKPSTEPAPTPEPATIDPADDTNITVVEENATYDDPTPNTDNTPTPQAHDQTGSTYVIRIRVNDSMEADQTVSNLLLMGLDAKVEVIDGDQTHETLYYVITSKMSEKQAMQAHRLVHQSGMDSILVEVKP